MAFSASHNPPTLHSKPNNAILQQCTYPPFLTIPVDVFKEIALFLNPGDILALARVNKFLRNLLMQRSAAHIWRAAEKNVELLPPCPRHLCEPQYAALVFSKECSVCGITVMRRMDEHLSVRLCNACRNSSVIGLSQLSSDIAPYVPISPFIKNPSKANRAFALRSDVESIERKLCRLPEPDQQTYKRWDSKRRRRIKERVKHAIALLRYNGITEVLRDDEIEDKKYQRIQDVRARLRARGWKEKHILMIQHDSENMWERLMDIPKPITDRTWERLYPKLLRLLKIHKSRLRTIRSNNRRWARHDLLDELLSEKRASSSACVELADGDSALVKGQTQVHMPFPGLNEVLEYHVFKELLETDRTVEATRSKFRANDGLVNNAILRWRNGLENHLIRIVKEARNAQKRELSTYQALMEEPLPFSTKLTASSYKHISPKNNVLFRADNVFKFHNERTLMFYPGSFTKFFDSTREMEELGGGLTASHLLPTLIEYSGEGNSIAAALLKELGRPDASSIEMDALGFRFFCNRCPRLVLHSWYSIVSHYSWEYNQAIRYNSESYQHPGIIYNNVHDWKTQSNRPLVRLLGDQEVEAHKASPLPPIGQFVDCQLCHDMDVDVPAIGPRKYVVLHLRFIHGISQPELGKHFIERASMIGGGLIVGSSASSELEE